jgi:crotonobetainyl-CoA:carnitine CoA-transferase CaiB-like acyl-CoA transferase
MGALSHLRIVEIGSSAAMSYCARLFADFGATVCKIEPPLGEPLRRSAPLTPGGHSAWFAFLNFNKSSVAIDPDHPNATSRLAELIGACDILLDGREILGGLLGLSDAEIEQLMRDGIIGTEMLMEEQLMKEKKRATG